MEILYHYIITSKGRDYIEEVRRQQEEWRKLAHVRELPEQILNSELLQPGPINIAIYGPTRVTGSVMGGGQVNADHIAGNDMSTKPKVIKDSDLPESLGYNKLANIFPEKQLIPRSLDEKELDNPDPMSDYLRERFPRHSQP